MALSKKPMTGMKDVLPAEMQVREYVIRLIKETYGTFGFSSIETPCVEHIENLTSRQGGENEKLIFKILKRGDKLNVGMAKDEKELVDSGLRYDLTLPLSRYYAHHANDLPMPFKALQIGSVWRADRPQKGRFRQFTQCDIDILGESSPLAEIELILATTTLLGKLGFQNFKIRLNDRRILKAMAAYSGFPEEKLDLAFIILDKLDKIGIDNVAREWREAGFLETSVQRYLDLIKSLTMEEKGLSYLKEKLGEYLEEEVYECLDCIMDSVEKVKTTPFQMVFDPTLVRGMSYYTGSIFEIEMEELNSSVAGGGRYDKMIGKFTGKDISACGFSIGFERIITILQDRGFKVPIKGRKKVYLLEKGMDRETMCQVMKIAVKEREEGADVLVAQMNKNKKFQKEQLMKEGYEEFKEFFNK
ncbi:histidine--tRNA ligase [bacterium 1XD42-8]|jgi:histidyl-tRNA synthetase|nr:histidine--tRNA ligase [Lachnospiraceae bacterium]RKJ50009.1 histidine--tRNA ligase [bacterium 1XD42-8]